MKQKEEKSLYFTSDFFIKKCRIIYYEVTLELERELLMRKNKQKSKKIYKKQLISHEHSALID